MICVHLGSGDSDCTLEPVHQSGWICSWADHGDPPGFMEWPCRSASCSDHPFPWTGCSGDCVFDCNVPEAACVLVPHWENLQRPVWGLQRHFGGLLCICGWHECQGFPHLSCGDTRSLSGIGWHVCEHHRRTVAKGTRVFVTFSYLKCNIS